MRWLSSIYLYLTIIGYACAQFSNLLPGGRRSSEDFDCVQEFGYYPHPTDCSRYYVCVFGGALEETCSSGLVYSTELQTCDWPRNVASCSARTGRSRPDSRRSGSLTSGHRPQSPHSSRNVNSRLLEPREPVRNSLNSRQRTTVPIADASAPFSVSERFRLLDHIDNREPQPFDFDASTGADGNKIVARRQQRLLSLENDRSRDNFQHSSRIIGNKLQLKPTEAPVRISTISSFSFGDTGTRSPVHITTPAPAISRPLTSPRPVSSSSNRQHSLRTRFPPRLTQSTFVSPPRSFGAGRSSQGRKTTPANVVPTRPPVTFSGSSRRPAVSGVTEPAYVAYFNDTIYDVYYIYDDDDVQYDELDYGDTVVTSVAPFLSSIATTPSTTTTKTTRRTTPTTTATTRRPERVTKIHTVFNQPKSTPSRRRIPLFSLDHIRQEVTGRKNANYKRPTQSKFNARKPQKSLPNKFGGSVGEAGGAGRRGSTTLGSSSSFGQPSRPLPEASFSTLSGGRTSSRSRHNSRSKHKQSASGSSSLGSARQVANTGLKSIRISGRHPSSSSSSRSSKRQNALAKSSSSKANVWDSLPQRPVPLYPQPIPDQPAERCDARCRLPDCNCGGKTNPGGLLVEQTPQLVVLTFDDSVNDLNHELYQDMFENNRLNPNGCPIAATFYVSHEWTNYKQVQNLYADGHEIASHSISHSFGEQFSTSKWEAEIAGQREILAAYGGVRMEDVRGMRAPFLSIGGNRMFKMLYNNNFTYDSSMPVYENNPPSWPYTMDYKVHHDCMIPPCPNKAYPGVWEVPMVMWQDLNGGRCSMVDACTAPSTDEGVYNMLIKNFQRHYTTNRAVFPLYFHAAWMTTKHHREGFMAFLDTISKMDDVWLVTNWQAIQWMRDPQPLSTIKQFQPFGCHYPERPPRCSKAKKCNLWHKSGVRYMTTCQPCPKKYPWTGRTGVAKP